MCLNLQVIRVKWSLHAREEIVFELLQHVRGNLPRALLEGVRKTTREMIEEQEAVRGRLFTIQDVMQSTVRAWLQVNLPGFFKFIFSNFLNFYWFFPAVSPDISCICIWLKDVWVDRITTYYFEFLEQKVRQWFLKLVVLLGNVLCLIVIKIKIVGTIKLML